MLSTLALAACEFEDEAEGDEEMRAKPVKQTSSSGYNVQLASEVRFPSVAPDADPVRGRALFGISPNDLDVADPSEALFEGQSVAAGHEIVSNGRTCFSCHRGEKESFGLPPPPLSDTIPLTDPLFTGIDADAGGDPDAFTNLNEHGLIKYRFNRFNGLLDDDDPMRQAFGWHKSPPLLNVGVQIAFLTDSRAPVPAAAAKGAIFAHTQGGDDSFEDVFDAGVPDDIAAFLVTLFTNEELIALRNPAHPLHDELVADPYADVAITTAAQEAGRQVFDQNCFGCHNMPNVFGNLDNVDALADGLRSSSAITWAASVGRAYDIGVAQVNKHNLRFTQHLGNGQFAPIIVKLAEEDGTLVEYEITFDPGLALTTRRMVDIGRFKVPQLRGVVNNAPYFHDNSAATLEEVIEYFNSPAYNNSADGQRFPINLSLEEQENLLEFLKIL